MLSAQKSAIIILKLLVKYKLFVYFLCVCTDISNRVGSKCEPKNSKIWTGRICQNRTSKFLNFYFFDKDTLPFHDELPKQPEHQTFKPRQNPENYEPCQKHLVPKPGHQTPQVFKPTKLWTFKQQGLDQPLNINLVIIFEPTFEWVRQ